MEAISDATDSVIEVIYNVLKKHGITREMITPDKLIIEDFGADSLDLINIVLAISEEFKIDVEEEDVAEIKTVRDITEYIKSYFNKVDS